jgi:hypothetical protein
MDRHHKSRAKSASGGVAPSKNVFSQTQVMRRKYWGALARIATMKRVIAESPGGAHHGGVTYSSDTAVDTEVLRFIGGLYINLNTTVLTILPSPL